MSKLPRQTHVWNLKMVSWTWKLSLRCASYRWWSKWKGKVSRLRKCSWDGQAYGAILTRQCRHAWMILSFSVLDELVPYTWTTFSCTVQKSCSSILFLISNVPTGRRTMSLAANAFFYPLDEPLGPFSPLQNGKESTVLYWYFKFTSQHFYHKRNIFLWILG